LLIKLIILALKVAHVQEDTDSVACSKRGKWPGSKIGETGGLLTPERRGGGGLGLAHMRRFRAFRGVCDHIKGSACEGDRCSSWKHSSESPVTSLTIVIKSKTWLAREPAIGGYLTKKQDTAGREKNGDKDGNGSNRIVGGQTYGEV
jgi:hypothetical protein